MEPKSRPLSLVAVAAMAILAGGIVGGSTNAFNGAVSPQYFRTILHWHHVEDVYRASIAQGIFEGLLNGDAFAIVFTLVVGIVSKCLCPFALAFRFLMGIVGGIFVCWMLGGLIAMGLALLSPEFYRQTFIGVPQETGPMLGYAWVGGSIWGAMFGSVFATIAGSILFAIRWRRSQPN